MLPVLITMFTVFSVIIFIFQHDIISRISSARVESSENVILSMIFSCFVSVYTIIQTNIAMGLSMYNEYFNRMAITAVIGLIFKWFAFYHFGLHGGIFVSSLIIICFLIIPMHYDLKRVIRMVSK